MRLNLIAIILVLFGLLLAGCEAPSDEDITVQTGVGKVNQDDESFQEEESIESDNLGQEVDESIEAEGRSAGVGSVEDKVDEEPVDVEKKIVIEFSSSKTNKLEGDNEYLVDEAESEMTYLILDLTVSNQGYEEFNTNPFYWGVIVDNVKYDVAFVYNLENEMKSRDVMDGGEVSGNIAFEVPENVEDFEVVYEAFTKYNIEYIQK